MKKFLSVLMALAIVMAVPAVLPTASAEQSGDFTYTVSELKATVTGYTGSGTAVVIPGAFGDYPVTAIGDNAFMLNTSMTSIVIPNNVALIGNSAFSGCTALTSVTIPDSVISIGNSAFSGCIALASVVIGSGVTTIGELAFLGCTSLASVTIPNKVTLIGTSAFRLCTALASVTIGSSVATVGGAAFSGDINLKEIYFLGNAPVMGEDSVGITFNYNVYYLSGKTGFTNPWNGHTTAVFPVTPSSPAIVSDSYNSLKLSWTASPGYVSGYKIYRLDPEHGNYPTIGTTTSTEYSDKGLTTEETYSYKIQSYVTVDGKNYYSSSTAVLTAKPVLPAPASAKAETYSINSIKISWDTVAGASGYMIFRYNPETNKYIRIGYTQELSFIDKLLTVNKTYSYKVKAYIKVDTEIYYSSSTLPLNAKPSLLTPASPKAVTESYNSVKLTWNAVGGATGYMVFRLEPATGIYRRIKITSSAIFTDTNLTTGATYFYKIKAYIKSGDTIIYSASTPVVSAKAATPTPSVYLARKYSDTSIKLGWSEVKSASGYVVYRYKTASQSYERIKVTKSTAYIDTGLAKGVNYYYKVRAYTTNLEGKNIYGDPTPGFKATT